MLIEWLILYDSFQLASDSVLVYYIFVDRLLVYLPYEKHALEMENFFPFWTFAFSIILPTFVVN